MIKLVLYEIVLNCTKFCVRNCTKLYEIVQHSKTLYEIVRMADIELIETNILFDIIEETKDYAELVPAEVIYNAQTPF